MPYLTDLLVAETAPREQDFFVWDTEIPGFGLKITPAGNKTFVFQWRPGGRSSASRRRRIGRYGEIHVEHARRMASEARAAIQHHKADPGAKPAVGPLAEEELETRLAGFFDGRSSSRSKIMAAAAKTFMREGSEASLETIAQEAGVARPTIYRYFPSKEELLREVIAAISTESTLHFTIDRTLAPYPALLAFSIAYRSVCLDEQQLALYRLAMTNAQYHADVFQIAGVRSQQRIHDILTKYLRHAMRTGKLRRTDPGRAAELFMSSVLGFARLRALVGFHQTSEHLDLYITEAVDSFVRALAPKSTKPEGA